MVTTQAVIDKVNSLTTTPMEEEILGIEPNADVTLGEQPVQEEQPVPEEQLVLEKQPVQQSVQAGSPDGKQNDDVAQETNERASVRARRSARIAGGIQQPQRYLLLTKLRNTTKKLEDVKERGKFEAIQKEIIQIFKELKTIESVMKPDIPKDAEILRCFVFLIEKFLVNGEFDKIKARLVANGAQQNRELYPNKSSPMASIHAIFTCFTLIAYIGNYSVANIDVKGAYV
jgi:hypothetical protein